MLAERSGSVVFRHGKGGKQRTVPLPTPARKALAAYLETRPPVASDRLFVGERGPLTHCGFRALCNKYSAIVGLKLHPHLLRQTFSHPRFADRDCYAPGFQVVLRPPLRRAQRNAVLTHTP